MSGDALQRLLRIGFGKFAKKPSVLVDRADRHKLKTCGNHVIIKIGGRASPARWGYRKHVPVTSGTGNKNFQPVFPKIDDASDRPEAESAMGARVFLV